MNILRTKRSRRVVLVAAIIFATFIIGWSLLAKPFQSEQRLVSNLPSGTDIDLSTTPKENMALVLAYKYNVKMDDLKNKSLGPQIKSFEMAQDVSVVFSRLDEPKKALEAYKIADNKKSSNESTPTFYQQYCLKAAEAEDITHATKMCKKALELLKKQPDNSMFKEEQESIIYSTAEGYGLQL